MTRKFKLVLDTSRQNLPRREQLATNKCLHEVKPHDEDVLLALHVCVCTKERKINKINKNATIRKLVYDNSYYWKNTDDTPRVNSVELEGRQIFPILNISMSELLQKNEQSCFSRFTCLHQVTTSRAKK